MNSSIFLRQVNSPWRLYFYLLWKLPGAWFMGVRLKHCTMQEAVVRLPFSWYAQNPFRSTYFAAQCAAGEFATGLMGLAVLQELPPVSMLVTHVEAQFFKKANQTLLFTCTEGDAIAAAIRQTVADGEAQTFRATAKGTLPDGSVASEVYVTWSFKRKRGERE